VNRSIDTGLLTRVLRCCGGSFVSKGHRGVELVWVGRERERERESADKTVPRPARSVAF